MKIFSIFNSISGEIGAFRQGELVTFIRLAGCNLRCSYCDTEKALLSESGQQMIIADILDAVACIGCPNVLITGGEPLCQAVELQELVWQLKDAGYRVGIETNGSLPFNLKSVDCWIADYKLNGSGMTAAMLPITEFTGLSDADVIKFVISSANDYAQAKIVVEALNNGECEALITFSAALPLAHAQLVEWMQADRLWAIPVSAQIHKFIWPTGEKEK